MKKILYILLFVPLFIVSSCEKNTNSSNFEVGDYAEGGVIFYVDSTGQHGLVSAQYDIGKYPWGCFELDIIGAVNTYIGSGSINTLSIVENCIQPSIAASVCLDYDSEGYTNWFLPSRDELLLMYNNIGLDSQNLLINNFTSGWYWSSSQVNNGYAFVVNYTIAPTGGFAAEFNKYTAYRVRPIRSF